MFMDPIALGVLAFVLMICVALIGVPIFVSMGLVGIIGLIYTSGFTAAMGTIASLPLRSVRKLRFGGCASVFPYGGLRG